MILAILPAMMKRMLWLVGVILLAGFPEGQAIITGNDALSTQAPSGMDWGYVYNYKNCSSVAISPYWILTAAHVADDAGNGSLLIGSTTYLQQEVVFHPEADLALVRYDKPLPGFYALYSGDLYAGDGLIMIGYGNTGTVSAAGYTDSGVGHGVKRWGSNELNAAGWLGDTYVLVANFDFGATVNEAGVGVYDSGGGSFIQDNGEWKLVGINISRGPTTPPYTTSYMTAVPIYEEWINQTVPEPDTAVLLVLVAAIFGGIKRLRYMYQ
jgi:hypothetical protein